MGGSTGGAGADVGKHVKYVMYIPVTESLGNVNLMSVI